MNRFPDRETVEKLRRDYPAGTVVILDECNDPYRNMPRGMEGVVRHIDDTGTLFADWSNGSGLGMVFGEDRYHKKAADTHGGKDYDGMDNHREKHLEEQLGGKPHIGEANA